ncbi:MAG: glutamine--tRNA ligase, partial [Sulfuricurvum sp.]|nr:glutamine--tRNA ligase [Sulfuricurvum sp.]
ATYHPDSKSGSDTSGIKVKSAIQWVEANTAKTVEVRLYDRLYTCEAPEGVEDLNPDSLKIIKNALVEPALISEKLDVRFQFERQGYFYTDPIDYTDETPVFNRIVGLKDSWNKKNKSDEGAVKPERKAPEKKVQIDGEVSPMSEVEKERFSEYNSETYGLGREVANILARDEKLSKFFEEAYKDDINSVTLANIVSNEVARELKEKDASELKFTAVQIAELVKMIDDEIISNKIAKQVFEEMVQGGENPSKIVESQGLVQISDPSVILPIIDDVMAKNPDNVEKYKAGNTKLFGFFVGQVLKATGGKANPQVVNDLVVQKLQ